MRFINLKHLKRLDSKIASNWQASEREVQNDIIPNM